MHKSLRLLIAALISATSFQVAVSAEEIPAPPAVHPRLYVTPDYLPTLRAKVESEEGRKILDRLNFLAKPRSQEEETAARKVKRWNETTTYFLKMRGVTTASELNALDYLLYGNKESARSAITAVLDTLRKANYGTASDMSRVSGRLMDTGAIVYDWCYDQMTPQERQAYIDEFLRIAKASEGRYPLRNTEMITGHLCEWIFLRDYLSVGIAIYDEYPEFYRRTAELLYEKYFPARNYIHKDARSYHQGASYISIRFGSDLYASWILQRMGAPRPITDDMHYVPYELLYRKRPDGGVLPGGDIMPYKGKDAQSYADVMMLAGSLYNDPYLIGAFEQDPQVSAQALIYELLFRDFSIKGKGPETLPLSMYSGGIYGWTFARTGWDGNSAIVEMKIGEHMAENHQHHDGGSFQIYYKGPLAIDTGIYSGTSGPYNSPHGNNYFRRTIAHNSLLIYDPDEKFYSTRNKKWSDSVWGANDGGQRLCGYGWISCNNLDSLKSEAYTVGKVLSHYESDRFSYLKGDITPAYSKSKAAEVRRSFVFENMESKDIPGVLVIYDHLVSTNRDFKKYFLLHSIEEPAIRKGGFTVSRTKDGDSGELNCTTLLPRKASISKVGGPGKEFWVFGENWANSCADPRGEAGAWRVEVCPSSASEEDCFLNVIQIGDCGSKKYLPVEMIDCGKAVAAHFGNRIVSFSRNSANIASAFSIPAPKKKTTSGFILTVTDLSEGKWEVLDASGRLTGTYEIKPGGNVLRLDGAVLPLTLKPAA